MFLALICNHPHNSPCWSFPSTIQHYPYLKTKQGLHWIVEPNEFPWFEGDPGDKSPGSMCFKCNLKPMQLFSQTSAASYVSFHLHGNLKINQAIHEPFDVLAGGTCLVFFFFNLKIEISLVEELILDAKVWSSDYSFSPSLIKCN